MTQRLLLLLCCSLLSFASMGQLVAARPIARTDSAILAKTFPLLALFEAKPALRQALRASPELQRLAQRQSRRSAPLLAQAAVPLRRYVDSLAWQPREIRQVGQLLQQAYVSNAAFRAGVGPLFARPSRYPRYAGQPDTTALRLAWQDATAGINRILRVYLASAKPHYPAIDSTSFRRGDAGLAPQLRQQLPAKASKTAAFYNLPLQAALGALRLNGRDEAARYEPLTGGLNAAPTAALARTDWARYPYTVLLVPGSGPEQPGVALDSAGAQRCRLAAARYRAGQAPFIVVSGGHVHPFRTPVCEAVEMKKYMVEHLGVPAAAVFIEPHARHTTTNLRNTARLLEAAKFPAGRPMLIVTDAAQSRYILGMAERCRRELGYVPYRDLERISDTENRCYPIPEAGQPDPFDPLDP
ncbi:YdcF family protein [Hymenobacter sp. BT559]|uniref:YdcF family protein n=1 Tax=Hymenobacter sp. BT559 TaxID=2795729 RepID=UPI0018EE1EDE|nr:YdcF family protein [Hymenobacter sp. BT559]MBJ6143921.1 YdcF family protein [Hymenobacter sp. BT559]